MFSVTLGNLPLLQEHIQNAAEDAGVIRKSLFAIDMVVEELFVNIVNHSGLSESEAVEVRFGLAEQSSRDEKLFCFSLRDSGKPFNPLEREPVVLEEDIDKRKQGGLGVHLVTKMSENCFYSREDDCNIVTVCFRCS